LIWDMWTNVRLKTKYGGKPFHYAFGQLLTQPHCLFEFFNESASIEEFQEQVLAFQNAERPVRLLYSLDSAIYDGRKYLDVIKDAYEGFYFNGVKLGFITPEMIKNRQGLGRLKLLIIPNVRYIKPSDLLALKKLNEQGIKFLMIGDNCFSLAPRGKIIPDTHLKNVLSWPLGCADIYTKKSSNVLKWADIKQVFSLREVSSGALPVVRSEFCNYHNQVLCFMINLGKNARTVEIVNAEKKPVKFEVLHQTAGKAVNGGITLPPYGVALVKINSNSQSETTQRKILPEH